MKKTIVFGSIFVIIMLLALPHVSAVESKTVLNVCSMSEDEIIERANYILKENSESTNKMYLYLDHVVNQYTTIKEKAPNCFIIYNLLLRIIFWIGLLLGTWPYH